MERKRKCDVMRAADLAHLTEDDNEEEDLERVRPFLLSFPTHDQDFGNIDLGNRQPQRRGFRFNKPKIV